MKICLVILAETLLMLAVSAPGASPSAWGVNGRTSPIEVWGDPATQFATMKYRGLKTYRFEVQLTTKDAYGAAKSAARIQNLIAAADQYKITLHPILSAPFTYGDATDHGRYPNTDAGLEAQGYDRVYPCVRQFATQIHDWELQNELSLIKGFKSGDGESASDYATPLAHQWAAVLRGMSKAIGKVRAETGQPLRIVVDTIYVDFGLIPFLAAQGVPVDEIAYHYYNHRTTDSHALSPPHGAPRNLFVELAQLGKPVIVNEFNAAEIYSPQNQHKPYNEAHALESLKRHIEYLINQREISLEGVEYYELYDEPKRGAVEGNFGLMKDPKTPKPQMLLAAVYACGTVSTAEQAQLVSLGLFTRDELSDRLGKCATANQ